MRTPDQAQAFQAILAVLDRMLEKIEAMAEPKNPPLTRCAFAKKVGRNRCTIAQWIKDGRILTRNGRIPHSELKKFLS